MSAVAELDTNPDNAQCLLDKWVLQDYKDHMKYRKDHKNDFTENENAIWKSMDILERIKFSCTVLTEAEDRYYQTMHTTQSEVEAESIKMSKYFNDLKRSFFHPQQDTKAICVKPATAIMMQDTLVTTTFEDLEWQVGKTVFIDFMNCGLILHDAKLKGVFIHRSNAETDGGVEGVDLLYGIMAITERVPRFETYGRPEHPDNVSWHVWKSGQFEEASKGVYKSVGHLNVDVTKAYQYVAIEKMVLVALNAETQLKPIPKPKLPRGVPPRTPARKLKEKTKRFTLFTTVSLNIRGARAYVKARGDGTGSKHSRQYTVKGHQRRQRYGIGNKLTKIIWIAPQIRGKGIKINKLTVV